MPVTRADELDARPADNAKELPTPVREALEVKIERLRKNHFAGMEVMRSFALEIIEALAAPEEPCAPSLPKRPFAFAVKRAPENGEDQWRLFMDEAAARAEAEQLGGDYEGLYRVGDRRSALTTQQPAAWWGEATNKFSEPVIETAIKAIKNWQSNKATSFTPTDILWDFGDVILKALRREAPAPAEGKNQAELLLNAAMDHIAGTLEQPTDMRAWSHLLIYCPDDIVSARAAARPDTAETRLREAVEDAIDTLESMDLHVDNPLYERLVKALSPPSGGDEAKESEGGCICQDQHRRGYCTEPGCPYAVRPSEPSPPADRREIVARNQTEQMLNAAMDHIAGTLEQPTDPRAWSHLLIYCPDDVVSARAAARPDTAEARLREAVEDAIDTLESMDLHVDNPLYERLVKALSPPSGGDQYATGAKPPVSPSEPSPPADRREIVARIKRMADVMRSAHARGVSMPIWTDDLRAIDDALTALGGGR